MSVESATLNPVSIGRPLTFDARAWLVWMTAAAVVTMTVRNPLYTLILLLSARVVLLVCATSRPAFQLSLWRLGLFIITFSALFNALFVRVGSTVLLHLPAHWRLLGGPITLEAMVYGAANGLLLLTLLAIFIALNAIVPVSELVRLTPRAFQDLGVVVLIALTYVPETTRHLQRIREAQAVRGHRLRGVRDWQPIVIPLLIGGLERAMQLAETMVARGYGATADTGQRTAVRVALVIALASALGGWVMALWWGWPGWLLLAAGTALLAGIIWHTGRQAKHTRYRPGRWHEGDTLLVATAVIPLLATLIPWPFLNQATLFYSPYPQLHLPEIDPIIALALVCLVFPAIWGRRRVVE